MAVVLEYLSPQCCQSSPFSTLGPSPLLPGNSSRDQLCWDREVVRQPPEQDIFNALSTFSLISCHLGPVPLGHMSTVCQPEAVLHQQLARLPPELPVPFEGNLRLPCWLHKFTPAHLGVLSIATEKRQSPGRTCGI